MTTDTPQTPATPAQKRSRIDWILILLALALFVVLALRAAVSLDPSVDAWWYRLPWAARLAGLMPENGYVLSDFWEQRFAGFPVLIEWIQGQLWRLTGRPQMANLVALGSLVVFVVFLRLRFKVPTVLALLGLVAVPAIQVSATGTATDLPANLALTAAMLMLMPLFSLRGAPRLHDAAVFFLACALAVHAKLEMLPLVGVVFALGLVGLTVTRLSSRKEGSRLVTRLLGIWIFAAIGAAIVFLIPIRNVVVHGDPIYPMGLKAGTLSYAGPQDTIELRGDGLARVAPGAQPDALAPQAATTAQPASPLEAAAQPYKERFLAWSDQVLDVGAQPLFGDAAWAKAGALKLPLAVQDGGFLGWYVLFNLGLFALLVLSGILSRLGILSLLAVGTALAIVVPDQTALSSYPFWIVLLISLNLIMLRPRGDLKPSSASTTLQRLFGLVAVLALGLGVYATQGSTLRPSFQSLDAFLAAKRDPAVLAQVQANPASCLVGEERDRVFLYAPLFNPGQQYRLKMGPVAGESRDAAAAACGSDWTQVPVVR